MAYFTSTRAVMLQMTSDVAPTRSSWLGGSLQAGGMSAHMTGGRVGDKHESIGQHALMLCGQVSDKQAQQGGTPED